MCYVLKSSQLIKMQNFLKGVWEAKAIPECFQQYLGIPDKRVAKLILFNSPITLLGIYLIYATVILGGLRIMRNRKPLTLRKTLVVYNCFQITFAAYICKEIFLSAYLSGYDPLCADVTRGTSPEALRMINALWCFYLSKIIDLMDTVFFVLRKKSCQLTFLHLYHHSSMLCNWYFGILYLPGGQAYFSAGLNAFVHTIMYTYYLLAAIGSKMQKYLWWKRYLTEIQLTQFVLVIIHIAIGCYYGCNKPLWLVCFTVIYLWSLVILFNNFYFHAYIKVKNFRNVMLRNFKLKTPNETSQLLKRSGLKEHIRIDLKAAGDMKVD